MTGTEAVIAVCQLLGFAITLLQKAQEASAVIYQAQSEGRDLTDAEVEQFRQIREAARRAALAEIMAATR